MKSLELFPVTIFKTRIENNDHLKELLVRDILETSETLSIPEDWTTHKVRTSFGEELEVIENNRDILESEYIECMREVFDRDFNVEFDSIWYNVYMDGEYQEVHDHLGTPLNPTHFSFIHFLSFNKGEHKPPEFRDPLSQIRNLSLELDRTRCGEVYVPDVKEGDLLMFPSYLQHCVLPGKKTSYPRITIAFNVRVTKYGNDKSYR